MPERSTDRAHRAAARVLAVYVLVVAVISLVPRPLATGLTPWVRGTLAQMHRGGLPGFINYDVVELAAHATLFLSLGILLAVTLGRRLAWLAALVGLGIGVLIEYWPTVFAPEHPISWVDLLLNSVGVVAGVAVGWWASVPRRPAATLG